MHISGPEACQNVHHSNKFTTVRRGTAINQITLSFAFTAGLLSFFSPCVFPLVPAYIAALTGRVSEEDGPGKNSRRLLGRSLSFIIGFSLIFILLGASASALGHLLSDYRDLFEKIGGFLVIVFGFQMIGTLRLTLLMREKRVHKRFVGMNIVKALLMGMFFALGWSPCIGLVLSSILVIAGSVETIGRGIGLLGIYSLGLAIPFFVLGLLLSFSVTGLRSFNRYLPVIEKTGGWLLVIMGLLLYTGWLEKLGALLSTIS